MPRQGRFPEGDGKIVVRDVEREGVDNGGDGKIVVRDVEREGVNQGMRPLLEETQRKRNRMKIQGKGPRGIRRWRKVRE